MFRMTLMLPRGIQQRSKTRDDNVNDLQADSCRRSLTTVDVTRKRQILPNVDSFDKNKPRRIRFVLFSGVCCLAP